MITFQEWNCYTYCFHQLGGFDLNAQNMNVAQSYIGLVICGSLLTTFDSSPGFFQISETDLCCICFEQVCTIEVQSCGHQMCAQCTLALCCHNKPNPTTSALSPPLCPFCRSTIASLVVAELKTCSDVVNPEFGDVSSPRFRKPRKSLNEGSSSFKGLMGSLGKIGGRSASENEWMDKP